MIYHSGIRPNSKGPRATGSNISTRLCAAAPYHTLKNGSPENIVEPPAQPTVQCPSKMSGGRCDSQHGPARPYQGRIHLPSAHNMGGTGRTIHQHVNALSVRHPAHLAPGDTVIKGPSPLNVPKYTYNRSYYLARSDEHQHLTTDSPLARPTQRYLR